MTSLNILYNQDIFDLANKTGYSIDNVFKLIKENPFITSINYDLNSHPGQSVTYDETFKAQNPQVLYQKASVNADPNRSLIAKENQSLFDVAIMTIGIEKVMQLVKNNNISNIDVIMLEGKIFNFSINDIKDKGFYSRGFDITTGEPPYSQAVPIGSFLLLESGFFILQENGDRIILE